MRRKKYGSIAKQGSIEESLAERALVAILLSIVCTPIHLLTYKGRFRKSIRKALIKARGTDKPVSSECEIDEKGLAFRSLGQELSFSWKNVQALNQTNDSIEVIMKPTGIFIIPKRIFGEPAELQEWINYIEDQADLADFSGQSVLARGPITR